MRTTTSCCRSTETTTASLLRFGHAPRQADAVLRRAGQPRQVPCCTRSTADATRRSGRQIGPACRPVTGDVLDYGDVMAKFDDMMGWLARTYVHAMNCIHYSHDKYNYERLMMALHDRDILRTMASALPALDRRRQPFRDQIRQSEADPPRGRSRHRLTRRQVTSRSSGQQRSSGRRDRGGSGEAVHGAPAQ